MEFVAVGVDALQRAEFDVGRLAQQVSYGGGGEVVALVRVAAILRATRLNPCNIEPAPVLGGGAARGQRLHIDSTTADWINGWLRRLPCIGCLRALRHSFDRHAWKCTFERRCCLRRGDVDDRSNGQEVSAGGGPLQNGVNTPVGAVEAILLAHPAVLTATD